MMDNILFVKYSNNYNYSNKYDNVEQYNNEKACYIYVTLITYIK